MDLVDCHDRSLFFAICLGDDGICANDLGVVDVGELLLMLHDLCHTLFNGVDEIVILVDHLRLRLFGDSASALCECYSSEVGTLKGKLVTVHDKVALALRYRESLQHHVEKRVGDALFGAYLESLVVVAILGLLDLEPCGFQCVVYCVVLWQRESIHALQVLDLRQHLICYVLIADNLIFVFFHVFVDLNVC